MLHQHRMHQRIETYTGINFCYIQCYRLSTTPHTVISKQKCSASAHMLRKPNQATRNMSSINVLLLGME